MPAHHRTSRRPGPRRAAPRRPAAAATALLLLALAGPAAPAAPASKLPAPDPNALASLLFDLRPSTTSSTG